MCWGLLVEGLCGEAEEEQHPLEGLYRGATLSIHTSDSPQASLLPFSQVEAGTSITTPLQPSDSWARSPGWRPMGMDPGPGGAVTVLFS